MSCNPAKALATLAAPGSPVAQVFGSPEVAARVLNDLAEIGRRTSPEPGQERMVDAQTAALFSEIRRAGGKPPTHSQDGLPKKDARPGYALVQRTLLALQRGDPLPEQALSLLTAEQRQRQIRGVTGGVGRYRCGACGRYAAARGGHFCPSSATPEALGRFLVRRLRVGSTAFPTDRLAALIDQARAGEVEMLHPVTGERVTVTLDGLPLALQGGFIPPAWDDEGLTAVVTPSGRIVRVFYPEGLQPAPAPRSALEQAAQASGVALTGNEVGTSPVPSPDTSWSGDAEKILDLAVRNGVVSEAQIPELRRIAEACTVLSRHGEYAGVGVAAAAEAVSYRSLDELRRIAGDPSVGPLSEQAQALAALLDENLPPLFLRAERGEALTHEEERRLYAYAGIQDRGELETLAEESRRLWAERKKLVAAYVDVDDQVFQEGRDWYHLTTTGGRSRRYTGQKAAREAAELYLNGALSANGAEHQARVRRIERLPLRWIDEVGGAHESRCPDCGQYADEEHDCPNAGGAGLAPLPATSAAPTFISSNIPTIAAYGLAGQGFERHREEQAAQAQALAAESAALTAESAARGHNWNTANLQRREAIRRELDALTSASMSRGRELLGQRAAILESFPTADLPSLTGDEALVTAWLAQPRVYLTDAGGLIPPHQIPLDALAKFGRAGVSDTVRAIKQDDPRFRYQVHRHFSEMPPERAAAIMVAEDEYDAYSAIRRQANDIIRRERAARQGQPADAVYRDTTAAIGPEEYRIVMEAAIREQGWDSLPKGAQDWFMDDQATRPQCELCMQFTPKYGTHNCPVRNVVGYDDDTMLEAARVALSQSLYLSASERAALAPGADPDTVRRLVESAAVRFPQAPVPHFGGTNRQLRTQPITLSAINPVTEQPVELEVAADVCDGLAVHEMDGVWRITHVGSGTIVSSAPDRAAALVGMQELLTRTGIDWTHPEPGAGLEPEHPDIGRAASIGRRLRQGDFKGQRASFPLPSDPQPLALTPGMGLAEGSEFIFGQQRFKATKVRGAFAVAYDHASRTFAVVDTAAGAMVREERGRPIRTPAAADRVLAAQQKGA